MSFFRKILRPPEILHGRYMYRGKGKFAGLALQLRVEPDRKGIMVINANTVLYLNETATAYAYFLMQGMPEDAVLKKIRRMYRVDSKTARKDYLSLIHI